MHRVCVMESTERLQPYQATIEMELVIAVKKMKGACMGWGYPNATRTPVTTKRTTMNST